MKKKVLPLVFLLTLNFSVWAELPFDIHGFSEGSIGTRIDEDPYESDETLREFRLQADVSWALQNGNVRIRSDFIYDDLVDSHDIDLEKGEGFIDLREAYWLVYPLEFLDLKIGRQILTWGTGDLIFINDLFPKDWRSFFIGRDVEYLKAPSDAIRASLFFDWVNLEAVYVPKFDSDRFINGEKISYWNDSLMSIAGQNAIVRTDKPDGWFQDDEISIRIYKNLGGVELAVYGYSGFWKSPGGVNPVNGKAVFPALEVLGLSIRGNFWNGIGNIEAGKYNSPDDSKGDNPFVRNGELRFLLGYEQELATDLTLGVQYYLEYMEDYEEYKHSLHDFMKPKDEYRHLLTLRLSQLAMNQNLQLSFFAFYSPSDQDAYIRPKVTYKFTDHLTGEAGGNFFFGEHDYTFFGQFTNNDNVYSRIRYSF